MTQMPVFVVACSGRCGSTLLSEMLERHLQVLSLSEFLVPLVLSGVRHAEQPLTAQQFCAALQTHMPTTSALLKAGITVPEFRYPFQREGARYRRDSGLPFPVNCALSHLTDDPDNAFDALLRRVLATNGTCARDHLTCTFQTLAEMFGGCIVVERSGGSLLFTAQIRALLPQASFILLTRSGTETALSMSRHAYFRHIALRSVLTAELGYDPYTSPQRGGVSALPPDLARQLPEHFTKAGFEALDLPLDLFGAIWAHHTERGLAALPARFHHLSYESLCAGPHATLRAVAEHIGAAPDPHWLAAAAPLVSPPQCKPESLPPDELAYLRAACEPGVAALARKGIV